MRHRSTSAGAVACGVLIAASLLASGCERTKPAEDSASATGASLPGTPSSVAKAPDPASEAPGEPETSPPRAGQSIVRFGAGGITVQADRVPRLALLREIQRHAGFGLEIAPGTRIAGTVTLRTVDATLDEVLRELLKGIRYNLDYGVDATSGERVLEVVAVGDFEHAGNAARAVSPDEEPDTTDDLRDRRRERTALTDDEKRERAERREQQQAAYRVKLDDPDGAVRADAAEWIHGDEDNVPSLAALLANDPDPMVRAAAAGTLGEVADSPDSLNALLGALQDPAPEVVIETLDAIVFVGDAQVIPKLTPLLSHPSPEVRESAQEAIEWLEE